MLMRFTIEERHLTDAEGRPIRDVARVNYHACEAENIDDCVRSFVGKDDGELLGTVLKFPGFQAVATVRKNTGVYTLQISPSSQQTSRV